MAQPGSGWVAMKGAFTQPAAAKAASNGGAAAAAKAGGQAAGGIMGWGNRAGRWISGALGWVARKPVQLGSAAGSLTAGVGAGAAQGIGKAGGGGLLWIAAQPFEYTMHGLAGAVRFVRGNPVTAGVVAVGAGALAWAGSARAGARRRTQQEILNQAANQQSGNPYQISEADAAALEARMKQGGRSNGFAAAEIAARNGGGQQMDQATTR